MSKDINYYLTLPYTTQISPPDPEQENGDWFAEIVELPGCMAQAETREETLKLLEESKEEWLNLALEIGKAIPEPVL